MDNSEKDKSEANEPSGEYGGKKIVFFKSFEEEQEYTHRQYASLTPSQRLARVTYMRLTAYPHLDIDLNPWGTEIYFD